MYVINVGKHLLRKLISQHTHTPTQVRCYICDECGKAFKQADSLAKHKHVLTGEKPFACDQCGKAVAYLSALTRHKHIHIDLMGVGIAEKMPGMESICCRSLTSFPLGSLAFP